MNEKIIINIYYLMISSRDKINVNTLKLIVINIILLILLNFIKHMHV